MRFREQFSRHTIDMRVCCTSIAGEIPMLYAIPEDIVNFFKYWNNSSIQEGLNFEGELYAHVRSYSCRSEAEELGRELAQTGIETCLTYSIERFGIWINLKSLAASFASAGVSANPVNS